MANKMNFAFIRIPAMLVIGIAACAMSTHSYASNRPLFDDTSPLDAVLTVPLTQAYAQKTKDVRPYLNGNFSYKDSAGETIRVPLKVKTRGNFRRANCSMPPLRLNFPVKQVKASLLRGQDKLKLVGPCQFGMIYRDLIGLEHLAYQIYQTVSDYSLKTRLLNLSYVDSDKKRKPRQATAFVIEDIKDLANRTNMKSVAPDKPGRNNLDLQATALLEVFALFIANNDYSTLTGLPGNSCCHNVRLLKPKSGKPKSGEPKSGEPKSGTGKLIPVPYDFDMSGLVNAPYGAPPGTLPIKTVRKRYFNGWCKDEKYFRDAVDVFKDHKDEIMALVDNAYGVKKNIKKKTKAYFEQFYTMVDLPKRYQKEITGRCRGKAGRGLN